MVDNLKQAINEVFRPKKSKVNNKQRESSQEKNEKTDDSIKKPAQARNDPNQKSLMQQNNSKESNKEFHIIKKRIMLLQSKPLLLPKTQRYQEP